MRALDTVVVADFLEEAGIETEVLKGVARLVLANATSEAELLPHLHEADALLLFHDISRIGEASFATAPNCRGVVRAGVGYNNVDLDAASRHGVVVCNVPDYGTEEVADHSIMLLLAVARRLIPSDTSIRKGDWRHQIAYGSPRLRGKTLGLIGFGRIGSATALRAKAFGLNVIFYDPYAPQGMDKALGVERAYDLGQLLSASHFVSVHCYLDDSTRHLINAETIAQMRPGAILINTARGPVVDQAALIDALDSGRISGAGLDVMEHEPLDDESLRHHPRVVLTPHSAFYSVEGFIELRTKAAEEIKRILLGEAPRSPVNVVGIGVK